MAYKYNELQVSVASQKLNCKASYKTPFFFIMWTYFFYYHFHEVQIEESTNY
jgi:hypothetical protein